MERREYIDFMIAVVPAFWDISTGPISHKDIVQNIDLVDVLEG